jgi:L-lactate utilization protein LutB
MKESELQTMRKSFKTANTRAKKLLETPQAQKLKERVQNIRKDSIENNEELFKTVEKTFKRNDIDYFFASTIQEAQEEILKLIKENSDYESLNDVTVTKSKSNTLREIDIEKYLNNQGIKFLATDLGDRILQIKDGENTPIHPTAPAAHLNVQEIANIVNNSDMGVHVNADAHEIMQAVRKDVLQKMENSDVGISGANSIAAEDGSIILIHNEGNINLVVSKKLHIVVAGIDKLVPTIEDAVSIAKLETIYATGSNVTSYMNVVSGPSKTADIEKQLFKKMYGAEKVVVILLDNGRSTAFNECLWCVGCGNCVTVCPVYNIIGSEFGYENYVGGRGVAFSDFIADKGTSLESGLFKCTLCGLCTENCPVSLPTNAIIEELRANNNDEGIFLKPHSLIKNNIKDHNSPF